MDKKELIKHRWESRYCKSTTTTKTCHGKEILFHTHRERERIYLSLSVAILPASHLIHTFVQCRLFIYSFCVFFPRTFPSLRHDEYNKVSICGNLRVVEKKTSEVGYRQLIGHDVEMKWLVRQHWKIHQPNVLDAVDLLSKSLCACVAHVLKKEVILRVSKSSWQVEYLTKSPEMAKTVYIQDSLKK